MYIIYCALVEKEQGPGSFRTDIAQTKKETRVATHCQNDVKIRTHSIIRLRFTH